MGHAAATIVIAGLDPAIERLLDHFKRHLDARAKPGHDEKR
jgi:hypothetical protein